MDRCNRKEFLHSIFIRGLHISKALFAEPFSADAATADPAIDAEESFKAAMALGIDPASVPAGELKSIVTRMRNEKTKHRSPPIERG